MESTSGHTQAAAVTAQIMSILEHYSMNEANVLGATWLGRSKFEPIVRRCVEAHDPVRMVLPAFPFKSGNRVDKVLGTTPDLGEELAMTRLQALCDDIRAVHSTGAEVVISSDGLVYNGPLVTR